MADNLCGPSNALQNFQKHSQADRTLQQDRLVTRNPPSQGFRSAQAHNAGLLDPEFEAFQAGQAPFIHPEHQGFATAGPSTFQQPFHPGQAGPSNWANDFQRLNISSPPPFQQQQFVQQRSDVGGWHQDFARHQAQQPAHPNIHPGVISSAYQHPLGHSNYGGVGFQPFQSQLPMQQQQQPQFKEQDVDVFDEEAFARAFDNAARQDLEANQHETSQTLQMEQDVLLDESAERLMKTEHLLETDRLGADLIHDPSKEQQERPPQDDADALARTAGQLLDSVRDNQSNKFQNSQFLELMRQLRDKEVMVEGNNIVGAQIKTEEDREAAKVQFKSLLRTLKIIVLDRDRPMEQYNSNIRRNLLRAVIALGRLDLSGVVNGSLDRTRTARTLQAMRVTISDDSQLPVTHQLDWFLRSQPDLGVDEANSQSWEEVDARIVEANDRITSEIDTTLNDTFVSDFLRQWSQPNVYGGLTHAEKESLLGYTYTPSPNPTTANDEHERRVEYILCPVVSQAIAFIDYFGFPRDTFRTLDNVNQISPSAANDFFKRISDDLVHVLWRDYHPEDYQPGMKLNFRGRERPKLLMLKARLNMLLKSLGRPNSRKDHSLVSWRDERNERDMKRAQEQELPRATPQQNRTILVSDTPVAKQKMHYRMRADEQWGRVEWFQPTAGPEETVASA